MAESRILPRRQAIDRLSLLLGIALIAIGSATWSGWILKLDFPIGSLFDSPSCNAREAVSYALLGLALLGAECRLRRLAYLAFFSGLVSLLILAELGLGHNFGIDEILIGQWFHTGSSSPQTSPLASSCILLASSMLVWRALSRARQARILGEAISGSLLLAIGLCSLLGYLMGQPSVCHWGMETPVNFTGASCLLLLGIGLLRHAWRASSGDRARTPAWLPLPPVILGFTLTLVLWGAMLERERSFLDNTTQVAIASLLSDVAAESSHIANDLGERLYESPSEAPARWDANALAYLESFKHLGCESVAWIASDGNTLRIQPPPRDPNSQRMNLYADEAQTAALRLSIATRTTVSTRPLPLSSGPSLGFMLLRPVYSQDQLVGFVCATFNYQTFFRSLEQRLRVSSLYDLRIAIDGQLVFQTWHETPQPENTPGSLQVSQSVRNHFFRITLVPNAENLARNRHRLPEFSLLAGLSLTVLLGLALHFGRSARAGMILAEDTNRLLHRENEERRRTDEKLKISDERLRLALDSTGIGIFEWNLSTGYVYYSPGVWTMLDYEYRRMAPTVDAFQSLIHPEDLPYYRRRLEAQTSGATQFIDPEFRVRSHSGDWRWLYLRARSIASTQNTGPSRIVGTIQDLTARREAEDALRSSQAAMRKLSLVASRTENPVIILSSDSRVEWINDSFIRLLEYTLPEIVGTRAPDFLSGPDTDPVAIGRIRTAITQGRSLSTDILQYSKSGRSFHLSYDIQPVRNRGAAVENYIIVASDVTSHVETELALRRAKTEADEASRSKSEFLASMSHEIRTPMNGVIGMTALLLETPLGRDQREYVNTIRSSGESLLTIINDILDFSKIESGHLELERRPFELTVCIEDAVELFSVQACEKHLDLIYHIERDVPLCIVGDVLRLRQILVNLINNAVKFTASGSVSVEVGLAQDPRASLGVPEGRILLEFRVTDTGIGIPADRLDRLFKVFSQIDSSTTRRFGGTGLGLAICERLCALMGGGIRVESTEGKGSTFLFTLQTEAAPSSLIDQPVPVPPRILKGGILAIAQNPILQRRLHALLSAWGPQPVLVNTIQEATDLVVTNGSPPALLIASLDLAQPAKSLAALAPIPAPRLILIPFGFPPPEVPEDGQPYFFITKPLRAFSLPQCIANFFSQESIVREEHAERRKEAVLGEEIPLDVLLVEDNPVNQKVALRFLGRLGYKAEIASNGIEAIQMAEQGHFHLIIMDLQMPEMDGLEATRKIRTLLPPERQPKIIALTANALVGDREICLAAGMDDYITKPLRIQYIAEAIQRQFPPKHG